MFPGNVVLYEQFQNLWLMPSLYTVATLNVAECLKTGPKKIRRPGGGNRIRCRVTLPGDEGLASAGIFKQVSERTFSLNSRARHC